MVTPPLPGPATAPQLPESGSRGAHRLSRWSAACLDETQEALYRSDRLPQDIRLARAAIGIVLISNVVFLWGDNMRYGMGPTFAALGLVRIVYVLWSVLVWRRIGVSDPRRFDAVISAWLFASLLMLLVVNSTRPPMQMGHLLIDVVAIMAMYSLLPAPLGAQILGGLSLAAIDLGAIAWSGGADAPTSLALGISYLMSNGIGLLLARQLRRSDRHRFASLQDERLARESLQTALAQVRVLSGLLPVCAWCQRIRDADDSWQPLESYVARHSEAEFTHGICEECSAKVLATNEGGPAGD